MEDDLRNRLEKVKKRGRPRKYREEEPKPEKPRRAKGLACKYCNGATEVRETWRSQTYRILRRRRVCLECRRTYISTEAWED